MFFFKILHDNLFQYQCFCFFILVWFIFVFMQNEFGRHILVLSEPVVANIKCYFILVKTTLQGASRHKQTNMSSATLLFVQECVYSPYVWELCGNLFLQLLCPIFLHGEPLLWIQIKYLNIPASRGILLHCWPIKTPTDLATVLNLIFIEKIKWHSNLPSFVIVA